jgi:hypothetical protein
MVCACTVEGNRGSGGRADAIKAKMLSSHVYYSIPRISRRSSLFTMGRSVTQVGKQDTRRQSAHCAYSRGCQVQFYHF